MLTVKAGLWPHCCQHYTSKVEGTLCLCLYSISELYLVSSRERPWRQHVYSGGYASYRARILCVFSHIQQGTPGLMHKGCVLQHVSLSALRDVRVDHRSWDETKYRTTFYGLDNDLIISIYFHYFRGLHRSSPFSLPLPLGDNCYSIFCSRKVRSYMTVLSNFFELPQYQNTDLCQYYLFGFWTSITMVTKSYLLTLLRSHQAL